MIFKTPSFWSSSRHWKARMLVPLAFLYTQGSRIFQRVRQLLYGVWVPPLPVICVGNFVAGGAGKTPVALSLGEELKKRGVQIHFVTRGYGGKKVSSTPLLVQESLHGATAVGDEPLLLAQVAPTWVGTNRRFSIQKAFETGAQMVILDDGLQDGTVKKTFSLGVVDGERGIGNGRVLPAGPLREPLTQGLSRVQGLIWIGGGGQEISLLKERIPSYLPCWRASLKPTQEEDWKPGPVVAFAGLAYPEKFFNFLKKEGYTLLKEVSFPDHFFYESHHLEALLQEAHRQGAQLVTTEKDGVRLPANLRSSIKIIKVKIYWEEESLFQVLLDLLNPKVNQQREDLKTV